MKVETPTQNVRFATLSELRSNILPNFISPVPSVETLRGWFRRARVGQWKCNPSARHGGGVVYYKVADVERMLRNLGN